MALSTGSPESDGAVDGSGVVLVLRALGLGDAMTGMAALRGIRRRWPGHRLVLAGPGEPGALLRRRGLVDDVVASSGLQPLPRRRLADVGVSGGHVAVNLHGRGPQSHRLLQATRPGRLVAFRCDEAGHADGPDWTQDEHEVHRWCRLVRDVGGVCSAEDLLLPEAKPASPVGLQDAVVVHPGASSGSRRWPAASWRRVAVALASSGQPVVVTGGEGERGLCAEVASSHPDVEDLSGRLDLEQLCGLVAHARLLLSGDTGVAHVATAWSTPSVTLFGPVPAAWWAAPVQTHLHTALWAGGDAEGPLYMGEPHGDETDPVLARITVEQVLAAAGALLPAVSRLGGVRAV